MTIERAFSSLGRHGLRCVVCCAVIVGALLWGRGILGFLARQVAARRVNDWSISESQQWLAWSAQLSGADGQTELLWAIGFRRLGQMDRWSNALRSAQLQGAADARIRQEFELGRIWSGGGEKGVEIRLGEMVAAAASPHDVAEAFVRGYLARGDLDEARLLLEGWEAGYPDEAHTAYMWGVYRQHLKEPERARQEFELALTRQPRHEPAFLAIAAILEAEDRLDEASIHYADLLRRFPGSEPGIVGLARVCRKLGRVDQARRLLRPLATQSVPSVDVVVETAQVHLDCGEYQEAEYWFAQAGMGWATDMAVLSAAATASAIDGEAARADQLYRWYFAATGASTRLHDLQTLLAIDPHNQQAGDELQGLHRSLINTNGLLEDPPRSRRADRGQSQRRLSGGELFKFHCEACHGTAGGGNGRAARHLTPRPRDFRTEHFRLVSTLNAVASLDDLQDVLRQGMPGTSMPAYDHLSEVERELLAAEVLRLHREGVRDQYLGMLREEGEEVDEVELRQLLADCTEPSGVVEVPSIGAVDPSSVARGKDAYFELGCAHCHGRDGRGDRAAFLFDEKDLPTRARDLVQEPFKGGQSPEAIYLRIAAGMPGSPHPAAVGLSEEQLIALVQYCRSLSKEPKRTLTNHQHSLWSTSRDYLSAFSSPARP